MDPILNYMNPVHASRLEVFKSRIIIIIPPTTLIQVKNLPSGFPTTMFYSLLILPKCIICSVYFILLDRIILIISLKEYVMNAPLVFLFYLLMFFTLILFILLLLSYLYLILLVVLILSILLFCFLGSKSDEQASRSEFNNCSSSQ